MMASAPILRACEKVFNLLAWGAFALGVVALTFVCAQALMAERTPAPEQFLSSLGVILAATLVPTFAFRALAALLRRRRRAAQLTAAHGILGSMRPFDDSTLGG